MSKRKVNITVDSKAWKEFSKRCRRVGLNASRVISVFVNSMWSEEPLEATDRFIKVTKIVKRDILNL
jgi:antitoxin component of RelBE/YafQ-DinJ toxin-antitoxin module